jgi:hypothetical protein
MNRHRMRRLPAVAQRHRTRRLRQQDAKEEEKGRGTGIIYEEQLTGYDRGVRQERLMVGRRASGSATRIFKVPVEPAYTCGFS